MNLGIWRTCMKINLHRIRKIVAVFFPICISICAALLLDLKSNIKLDCASILYFFGLIFFLIACYKSNALYNKCNNYESIYIIRLNEYERERDQSENKPNREQIYEKIENRLAKEKGIKTGGLQYCGFIILGILGLVCVIFSYIYERDITQKLENQNIISQQQADLLQYQNDSLGEINNGQENKLIFE